jgi:hypothetical protein
VISLHNSICVLVVRVSLLFSGFITVQGFSVDQLMKKFDAVLARHEKIPAKGYNDDDENKQILNEVSNSRSPFKV